MAKNAQQAIKNEKTESVDAVYLDMDYADNFKSEVEIGFTKKKK